MASERKGRALPKFDCCRKFDRKGIVDDRFGVYIALCDIASEIGGHYGMVF
jgi:hypothetical protein